MTIIKDQKVREQALNLSKSWVIIAPAGSGKTELLTQRILKSLTKCSNPQSILAITFTNKAANEMRERLIKTLQAAFDENSNMLETTKKLAQKVIQISNNKNWDILNKTDQLQIMTIDALSAHIINLSANDKKRPLQPNAEPIIRESINWYLQTQCAYDHPTSYQNLLELVDNNYHYLTDLCYAMLNKREQWSQILLSSQHFGLNKCLKEQIDHVICYKLNAFFNKVDTSWFFQNVISSI